MLCSYSTKYRKSLIVGPEIDTIWLIWEIVLDRSPSLPTKLVEQDIIKKKKIKQTDVKL